MAGGEPYQRMLEESLRGELRLSNAHLPDRQKSLTDLLAEDYPSVSCSDGSTHLFKRKEIEYLTTLIEPEDQAALLLPIIIEVAPSRDEISILCRSQVEEKLVSAILKMPLQAEKSRIKLYGPQLSALRRYLKTTTQYLFSPGRSADSVS